MSSASEKKTNPSKNTAVHEAVSKVKSGLGLFTLAMKNFALYPEANHIRRQSLTAFHQWLESFFEEYEFLHLDVERDRLLLASETVYQDKPNEQSLVYPLFRDGIQWFRFNERVEPDEVGDFINLLNRFRILKEEASDDLATALWEADFPHIKYKTADDFWESDPMADIAALKAVSEASGDVAAINHLRSGSNTVGYVLRALVQDKDEEAAGDGDTAGLAPGMHLHPTARGGKEGVEAAIEALEGLLSGQSQVTDGFMGAGSGSPDSDAAGGKNKVGGPDSEAEDSRALFIEILAALDTEPDHKSSRPVSGALSAGDGLKPRAGGGPVVIEENSGDGSRLTPTHSIDDDDDAEVSAADVVAKAAFKASSYFKDENSEYLWPLAPNEETLLQNLIATEEHRNFTQDCLDILMVLVENTKNQPAEQLSAVLDFLADEVQFALSQGDFHHIRIFIENFNKHISLDQEFFEMIRPEFQQKMITPEVLGALSQTWKDVQLTDESLAELRRFLLLLPPEAIHTLVPVLTRTQDQRIEKTLLEVVAVEAGQINVNLVPLISTLKMSSILELIGIFKSGGQAPPCPAALLAGLSRNESPHVREEAARTLIEQSPESIKTLLHLIDDPNPAINTLICMNLGKQRSPLAEKVLFDYLNDAYYEKKNQSKEHVLNCYWAFGHCASAQGIPFLQDILLKKDWKSLLGFDGHWHRLGAAMALMLMPEEWGGREILKAAQHSRFKNIRQVCQMAEEELRDYRRKAGDY